jgi:predicted nucleotidyltransferase
VTAPRSAPADLSRYDDVLAWLRAYAAGDPDVHAVWLGGSVATGGYDDWSDIDVEVLCTAGQSVRAHDALLAAVAFPVVSTWRLPPGTWPDGRQSFLTLHDDPGALAEPTRIVDLHVHDDTPEARRVDARRHGRLFVLHDPDGIVEQADDDERDLVRRRVLELDQIAQRRDVAGWLVARSDARKQPAEAIALYLRFGLMALVTLLRNETCPWRFDYGLRYLDIDLPADQRARVESLLPGTGPLTELSTTCFAWMDELLAASPTRGSARGDRVVVGAGVPEGFTRSDAEAWLAAYDVASGTVEVSVDSGVLLVEHSGLPSEAAGDWLQTWQERTLPASLGFA